MKILNCSSLVALVAGALTAASPAIASAKPLSVSPSSIEAGYDLISAADLSGSGPLEPVSQQQQQQQQQQQHQLAGVSGALYGSNADGFQV